MAQTPFGQISLGHTLLQTEPETQSPVDLYMPGLHTELSFIISISTYSFRYSKYIYVHIHMYIHIYIYVYVYTYIYKDLVIQDFF